MHNILKTLNFRRLPSIIISILLLSALDRVTKAGALAYLSGGEPFNIVPDVLLLTYVENRGAAFGIFEGKAYIFILIAAVVTVFCLYFLLKLPGRKRYLPLSACLTAIVAGALGNVIDRLLYGYVVDFIYFKPIDFPVFNVADIYITCGCFLLVLLILFYYKDDELELWK